MKEEQSKQDVRALFHFFSRNIREQLLALPLEADGMRGSFFPLCLRGGNPAGVSDRAGRTPDWRGWKDDTGKRTYKGDSSDNLFKCPFFASDDRVCSKNTVDFDGSRDGKYPEYASDCAAEMRKNNTSAGSDPDGVGWRRGKG